LQYLLIISKVHLLEVIQRISESSPVSVIGEAMWGDECGSVFVLQVHPSAQHAIDSHAAIQSCITEKPELSIQSITSELYASPSTIADENLQLPLYIELTTTNLAPRRAAAASFIAAHSRFRSFLAVFQLRCPIFDSYFRFLHIIICLHLFF
jgi:hypothetical protein